IDNRLPVRNLFGDFVANAFDSAQFVTPRRKNALRLTKHFKELAQPNRPHRRQHVKHDAGFGGIHFELWADTLIQMTDQHGLLVEALAGASAYYFDFGA